MSRLRFLPAILLALAPLVTASASVAATDCQFILGFATLKALLDAAEGPDKVGQCLEDQRFNPANGDALQQTTGGLLVWRKLDNWTAFTDGYRTWINGPDGLQAQLNTERFSWEPVPWPPEDAAPLGVPQTVYYDGNTLEVTVLEVKRNANSYLQALHRTYIPPPAGQEDVGVWIRIRYLAGPIGREIASVPIVPTCVWGTRWGCLRGGASDLLQFRTRDDTAPHERGFHGVLPVLRPSTWIDRPNDGWRTFRVPQDTPFVLTFTGQQGPDSATAMDTVFHLS